DEATLAKFSGNVNSPTQSDPLDVLYLATRPGNGAVFLYWAFQSGSYGQVLIRRDTTTFPDATSDGTFVYNGTGDTTGDTRSFTDGIANGIVNGTKYYYTAFAHNGAGSYAPGLNAVSAADVLPDDLVGYYQFFGAGNTDDSSGKRHDGEKFGDADSTGDLKDRTNQAFHFDGDDDYMEIDNPFIDPTGDTEDDFTIAFWLRTGQTDGTSDGHWYDGRSLVDGRVDEDWNDFGVALGDGKIMFGTGNSGTDKIIVGDSTVANEEWHQVAVTRTRSDGVMKIYVDGQLDGQGAMANDITLDDPYLLRIGAAPYAENFYRGDIDEIRFYAAALSDVDVHKLYSHPLNLTLPHTAQTTCYNTAGAEITCPDPENSLAQDGSYIANQLSFTENGDDTVSDNVTGLMWQQSDDNTARTHADADTYCDNLELPASGFTDWRLPNIRELLRMTNFGTFNPAVDYLFYFTDNAEYWSDTEDGLNSGYYWTLDAGIGSAFSRAETELVRCVRGGDIYAPVLTADSTSVRDKNTGLVWQKSGDTTADSWENAVDYCEGLTHDSLGMADMTDWRLPNIKELASIIDYFAATAPVVSADFSNTGSSAYWSTTTDESTPSNAWTVDFGDGSIASGDKTASTGIRCVRGGVDTVVQTAGLFGSAFFGTDVYGN
ncbi:MAG: DUF1566 domain-containing protein, partial [Proteobacteria bacterium]|nr:DUF1566 domain-containing protein [Pseudomonadota bacterium]